MTKPKEIKKQGNSSQNPAVKITKKSFGGLTKKPIESVGVYASSSR